MNINIHIMPIAILGVLVGMAALISIIGFISILLIRGTNRMQVSFIRLNLATAVMSILYGVEECLVHGVGFNEAYPQWLLKLMLMAAVFSLIHWAALLTIRSAARELERRIDSQDSSEH